MLTYQAFRTLLDAAPHYDSFAAFVQGPGVACPGPDALPLLRTIYTLPHPLTFRSIRALSGLSLAGFARQYDLKQRSVEHWDAGDREPLPYLLRYLAYAVIMDAQSQA